MTRPILESLFYGKINPWECRAAHSAERVELERKISAEKQYFMEKMSSEDSRRFESLESLYTQAMEDDEIDIFSHGFSMGVLIMLEVLSGRS